LIKEYQDAYGAELRTFLETGAKIEIVERDDGYIDYHEGIPYYFAPYTVSSTILKFIVIGGFNERKSDYKRI